MKIIHDAVSIMTPFLLAAAGGLLTELSGALTIALEGFMLIGAFSGVVFAHVLGNTAAGIITGALASTFFALIYSGVTYYLKANIFIAGLAANLLASGLTAMLSFSIFGTKGVIHFADVEGLKMFTLPLLGEYSVMVYVSWAVLVLVWFILNKTPLGLRIRGTGFDSETIRSAGLRPGVYRLIAVLIAGFSSGLAGSMLSLKVASFVPDMTAGRGWIALVVIYLGNRTLAGVLAASFIFGLSISFSNFAQGIVSVPSDLILAFPYLLTVSAMIVYSIWHSRRKGAAL